jgi:hypothetical protein
MWMALGLALELGCGAGLLLQKPDGSLDGTHLQERAARKLASFVAKGLGAHMISWSTTEARADERAQ